MIINPTIKFLVFASALSLGSPQAAAASGGPPCRSDAPSAAIPDIALKRVAEGLTAPLALVHAGDGSGRLFIVEQGGTIRTLSDGQLSKGPFLDIRDRVRSGGETGLLGLAFHPSFSKNGRLFVNYTSDAKGLHTRVSEFRVEENPERVDPDTERILLKFRQPYSNHNGGQVEFGPDGYLYIGTGDGGAANDPGGNGQSLATLLGKMLRIDVDGKGQGREYAIPADNPFNGRKGAAPEIWAYGLRNPWRFSFDPVTRMLYAGDVGQNAREEIDIVRKGRNYGWNTMEGNICTPGVNRMCKKTGLEPPILDYPRSEGTAVIGGYVYRGTAHPELCGVYLYADYGNGRISGLRFDGKTVAQHRALLETGRAITSFGIDEAFGLYVIDQAGGVFKIVSKQDAASPQNPGPNGGPAGPSPNPPLRPH